MPARSAADAREALRRFAGTSPSDERFACETAKRPSHPAATRRDRLPYLDHLERLQQHLRHLRQPALGVADELLEDLVRHFHELLHAGEALAGELHFLLALAAL